MAEPAPILLAEDDEDDIFLMRRAFQMAGPRNPLMVVRDGREAIWYLNAEGIYADRQAYPWPCMLLLDLKMPLVNGFDVLIWLQKRRRPKNLLVVILTSSTHDTDIVRALELGADAYWVKPQSFHELVASVRTLHDRLHEAANTPPFTTTHGHEERL
jgi:DNA-binding response OmpR family regulator